MKLRLPQSAAHRLILFLSLGIGTALVGTGVIYGITGLGSYDLPREAWQMESRRQSLMRAGAWEKFPPPSSDSVPYDDFLTLVKPLKPIPSYHDDPRTLPITEVRRRHAQFAPLVVALERLPRGAEFDYGKPRRNIFDFEVKAVAQGLVHNAVLAARLGDHAGALRSLKLVQNLARLQVASSLLDAMSTEALLWGASHSCAEIWPDDAAALAQLETLVSEPLTESDLRSMVRRSELEMRNALASYPVNGWTSTGQANDWQTAFNSTATPAVRFPSFPIPERMLRDAMLARHYSVYATLIAAADSGPEAYDKAEESIESFIDPPASMSWAFASTPWFGTYGTLLKRREARWKAIRSGIAVVLHPDRPLLPDPFLPGHPLRLVKSATGFTVYSVGENGKDDGGILKNSKDVGYEFNMKR